MHFHVSTFGHMNLNIERQPVSESAGLFIQFAVVILGMTKHPHKVWPRSGVVSRPTTSPRVVNTCERSLARASRSHAEPYLTFDSRLKTALTNLVSSQIRYTFRGCKKIRAIKGFIPMSQHD